MDTTLAPAAASRLPVRGFNTIVELSIGTYWPFIGCMTVSTLGGVSTYILRYTESLAENGYEDEVPLTVKYTPVSLCVP